MRKELRRYKRVIRTIERSYHEWDAEIDPYGLPLEKFQRISKLVDIATHMSVALDAGLNMWSSEDDEEHF